MKLRESIIMRIHYATALGAVVLVAIHILFRFTNDSFAASLTYENVIANYQLISYAILLELILILITVHGFNGLRGILLEYRSGKIYEKMVNYGSLISMVALIAYGSRTIILANMMTL